MKFERDKEIEYLQEQLEMLINEKISLQNHLTDLETQLKAAKYHTSIRLGFHCFSRESPVNDSMLVFEVDRLKLKVIELEELVEKQKSEIAELQSNKVDLEQCRNRIVDLEGQLTAARQMQDPMSLPLGPPALRLRDLQLRIDVQIIFAL